MKRIISLLLCVALTAGMLCSCSRIARSDELKIVCTTFVQYDFAKNILGSDENLILLIDNGADLHGFEPTAEDIVNIATASLFVYGGGVSDNWVTKTLEAASNDGLKTFALMDYVEPLCADHEHAEHEGHEHHHEENEIDEHVWLSLKNAVVIVEELCDAICGIDPDNAEVYKANAAEYTDKLNKLDADYEAAISDSENNFLLFADRFPFIYLMTDYSLEYHAAFTGCSSETQASTETMKSLIDETREHSLSVILIIDGSDGRVAQQVSDETGAEIMTLNSCQSVSMKEIEKGVNYLDLMTENLEVIKEALN